MTPAAREQSPPFAVAMHDLIVLGDRMLGRRPGADYVAARVAVVDVIDAALAVAARNTFNQDERPPSWGGLRHDVGPRRAAAGGRGRTIAVGDNLVESLNPATASAEGRRIPGGSNSRAGGAGGDEHDPAWDDAATRASSAGDEQPAPTSPSPMIV